MELELENLLYKAKLLLRTKLEQQGNIPTYHDKFLRLAMSELRKGTPDHSSIQVIKAFITQKDQRFHRYSDRILDPQKITHQRDINDTDFIKSQGVTNTLYWKGLPLIKSAQDYAIIPQLIAEIQPKTIVELGSGAGGSALWMADIVSAFNLSCEIISIDRSGAKLKDDRINFIKGDITDLETLITKNTLQTLPKPWLLIEDAHEHVLETLTFLHAYLQEGDYAFIEDSDVKQKDIRKFMAQFGEEYRVDTRYTDFFGINATSALNSIFKKVK